MSDPLCVGVCMIDWSAGVCMGCGRTSQEIDAAMGDTSPETEANAPAEPTPRSEDADPPAGVPPAGA